MCEYAQCLFIGDARDWYWRYWESVSHITWPGLCVSLRANYGTFQSDSYVKDILRQRKQGPQESFDDYRSAIMKFCEGLRTPLSEQELIEIISKGLTSNIRLQILYLPITSMAHLKEVCLKGEAFYKGMTRSTMQIPSRNTVNR